jgi:general stress protein 26
MAVAEVDANDCVWFTTSEQSGKIDEISADPHVCVTLQDGRRFLSLSGQAELVHDREKIRRLWREAWRPWFPAGEDDPSVVLLRVAAREGEHWDRSGLQGLRYMFEAVRARVERRQMQEGERRHQRVQL